MPDLQLVPPGDWREVFQRFVGSIRRDALLASPFLTAEPIAQVCDALERAGLASTARVRLLTDLSPDNLLQGSTDPRAVAMLLQRLPRAEVSHLPRLHAKVYVADDQGAIVTAGNLTSASLMRNHEYGVWLEDPRHVARVRDDVLEILGLGAPVTAGEIEVLADRASELRGLLRNQVATDAWAEAVHELESPLLQARSRAVSDNHTFARTVVYLLHHYGPMSTAELHPLVQALHPRPERRRHRQGDRRRPLREAVEAHGPQRPAAPEEQGADPLGGRAVVPTSWMIGSRWSPGRRPGGREGRHGEEVA